MYFSILTPKQPCFGFGLIIKYPDLVSATNCDVLNEEHVLP